MEKDRRDFLKKAGTVAWAVPAMQAVNMASAAAGVEGSVVSTTRPPASTTTTTTTEAPEPCECAIAVVDIEPTGFGSYVFLMAPRFSCDYTILRAAVVAHPNSGEKAYLPEGPGGTWRISVHEDNLPADITMEFYTTDDVLVASCGARLEVLV